MNINKKQQWRKNSGTVGLFRFIIKMATEISCSYHSVNDTHQPFFCLLSTILLMVQKLIDNMRLAQICKSPQRSSEKGLPFYQLSHYVTLESIIGHRHLCRYTVALTNSAIKVHENSYSSQTC